MSLFAKLWTDILSDPKLMRAARLGAKQLHLLPWLIVFAKKAEDDGRLTVNGETADPVDIAHGIPGVSPRQVAAAIAELTALGVLVAEANGVVRFAAWEKRSGHKPSDLPSAIGERVAKHRAKKRAEKAKETPESNALRGVTDNATEKEKEKEKEIDQEEEAAATRDVDVLVGGSLRAAVGAEWPDVERFLASRAQHTHPAWEREMLKLIGPLSQFSAGDLAGACRDALMLDEPLGGPHALRAFVAKKKLERMPGSVITAASSPRPSGHSPIGSLQVEAQRIVGQIRRLAQENGTSRFIPRGEVAALGAAVERAYDAVGGARRFLSQDTKDSQYLTLEFARALEAEGAGAA